MGPARARTLSAMGYSIVMIAVVVGCGDGPVRYVCDPNTDIEVIACKRNEACVREGLSFRCAPDHGCDDPPSYCPDHPMPEDIFCSMSKASIYHESSGRDGATADGGVDGGFVEATFVFCP